MRKMNKSSRFLAVTLTASLATFGCTTNWNRSDGEPATGTTNANSPSATPGTSGGTTMPPPMTSSSQIPQRTPEQALAIMQESSRPVGPQAIVLGPSNPPNTGQARVGGYDNSAAFGTIRQLTINSSISNPLGPQPAVVSGAGEGVDAAALFGDVVAGTAVTPSTGIGAANGAATVGTVPSTISTAPATAISNATTVTPTTAGFPVTSGVFSASTGTLTPSASSGAVPSPTVATSPVVLGSTGMISSSIVTNGATTVTAPARSAGTVRSSVQAPLRLNRSAITPNATSTITVTQSATGKLVISNVK